MPELAVVHDVSSGIDNVSVRFPLIQPLSTIYWRIAVKEILHARNRKQLFINNIISIIVSLFLTLARVTFYQYVLYMSHKYLKTSI